ncbi:hypothetical protein EYF80_003038 [Liparis tanakae]|uniref:Uncharacterized protein n=1 Tax=Liparis tanakae TaxID=230148 RepID=A0A4Z2J914_9TELE|nr:hypothetical protein EYF80_003038 [Liparis tanakae]
MYWWSPRAHGVAAASQEAYGGVGGGGVMNISFPSSVNEIGAAQEGQTLNPKRLLYRRGSVTRINAHMDMRRHLPACKTPLGSTAS